MNESNPLEKKDVVKESPLTELKSQLNMIQNRIRNPHIMERERSSLRTQLTQTQEKIKKLEDELKNP